MHTRRILPPTLLCLVVLPCGAAETKPQTVPAGIQTTEAKTNFDHVRNLKIRGVLKDHEGKHLTGVVGVFFAIYAEKEGGAPLWLEVQNVEPDKRGYFTALVGSTKNEGVPPELFTAEKTLWLGKQLLLPGEEEQPRLLVTLDGLIDADTQQASREIVGSQQDQIAPPNKSLGRGRIRRRFAAIRNDALTLQD